jgi:hypothetical protein
MAENETDTAAGAAGSTAEEGQTTTSAPEQNGEGETATTTAPEASLEEITYHAVEKDGQVTAIWEMQGRKHLRTIDPRSRQGQDILRLYTAEHHDEAGATEAGGSAGDNEPASS